METERLYLYPLDAELLWTLRKDADGLCSRLGIRLGEPYGFFEQRRRHKVYSAKLAVMRDHPRSWLLATTWLIVPKDTMTVVGEAGFKGPPNLGEIEVGYGLKKSARNLGYMTETVTLLCRVAAAQQEYTVKTVMAKTLPGNVPSHRVLEKNGFARDGVIGKHWRWLKRLDEAEP